MLRFSLFNGQSQGSLDVSGAYVLGNEGVPLRAEVEVRDRELICAKRAEGPASLSLVWPIPDGGSIMLETSRLMDREKAYNLDVELVRSRLMHINQKREEWGLFDFPGIETLTAEIDQARDYFVEALKADDATEQSTHARQALKAAYHAGEHLTRFHADLFLTRRKQAHAFSRRIMGTGIDPEITTETYSRRIREAFDFAYVPVPWKVIEPEPRQYNWQATDMWVQWLVQSRLAVKIGPIIRFHPDHLPQWIIDQKPDYNTLRTLLFEHVRMLVGRYGSYVYQWDVVSGLHAENTFDLSFEQLMELSRVTTSLVKQMAPKALTVIDIVAPWGEYYARNQRTIPPMMYADMVTQSGVGFDALGVQFIFGANADGLCMRDLFQISERLDRLGNFGKPIHITAVQVPSKAVSKDAAKTGGCWHRPWNEDTQAEWARAFYQVAFSKPFVESVTWRDLSDRRTPDVIPHGGLLDARFEPRPVYGTLRQFREELQGASRVPPASRAAAE